MRKNIAIVLAGGIGSRLGLSTPKQFFKVAGKMVVEHTIDAFESNPHIDEIAIVSNPFYIADFESIIIKNGWKKVKKILKGGQERFHSSLSAIKAYEGSDVNLIFHDAVRPLVSQRILNDVIKALETYAAIDVAMPATDTIIEVDGDFIHQIPDRSKLKRGQTPQAFHLETISHAYEIALKDEHFKVTDDCGVVVKYLPDVPVYVVTGEESNMKLTYKEDTYLLDKFFQLRKSELNEIPLNESQLKGKVAVIFGGSYGIGEHTARMLQEKQAKVFCFSRSMNGVDVGKKEQVADALKKSILTNPQNRLYHQHGWRPQQRAFDEFGLSNDIQCGEHQLYGNYQRSDGGVRLFKRKQREISFLHLQFLYSRQSFLQHLFLYESGHCKLCTSYRTRMGTVWHCC